MTPATAQDVENLVGDIDALAIERILMTKASAEEVAEALEELQDERTSGQRREPSSTRAAEVRQILEEVMVENDEMEEQRA